MILLSYKQFLNVYRLSHTIMLLKVYFFSYRYRCKKNFSVEKIKNLSTVFGIYDPPFV